MPYIPSWSNADKERLKILHKEGKSIPEAAEILGKSYDSVRHKSRYLGLTLRRLDPNPPEHQKWWRSEVETLMRLVEEGLSRAEIGRRMGLTKNAVIGKLNRIGYIGRQSPPEPRHYALNDLLDLEDGHRRCLWPVGHPNETGFYFCSARQHPGRPYCGEHMAVAYLPERQLKALSSQE